MGGSQPWPSGGVEGSPCPVGWSGWGPEGRARWFVAVHQRGTYRSHLSPRIVPEFGHRALSAITAAHIEAAQRSWKSAGVSPTVVAARPTPSSSASRKSSSWESSPTSTTSCSGPRAGTSEPTSTWWSPPSRCAATSPIRRTSRSARADRGEEAQLGAHRQRLSDRRGAVPEVQGRGDLGQSPR